MKKSKNIGWQKYEDVLESQINSPLIEQFYQSVLQNLPTDEEEQDLLSNQDIPYDEHKSTDEPVMLTLDKDFSNEILLATNYDCWVGHTNFNLTENIKEELNKVEGVEVLKICSRYRFFIGIGRMFDFKEVRKNIEEKTISKEKNIEQYKNKQD
jgi:hypothetical protein